MKKTTVIAEIGINHNGNAKLAWELIDAAKAAGADAVKFQKRDIETCYTEDELAAPCESPWGATVRDKVVGRELGWDSFRAISDYCATQEIGWSTSCFDLNSLRALEAKFGEVIAFHKVPSCMSKHPEFLRLVASYGRLTLVSVALAEDREEIKAIAKIFEDATCPYVLNVTTALYPTPPERVNLDRLRTLFHLRANSLTGLCRGIGYSGHETGVLPSVVAAMMGAEFVERHFTLDRTWYGGDQAASLEPKGLAQLCRDIAQLPVLVGSGVVELKGDEKNPVPTLKGGS